MPSTVTNQEMIKLFLSKLSGAESCQVGTDGDLSHLYPRNRSNGDMVQCRVPYTEKGRLLLLFVVVIIHFYGAK